MRRYLPFAGVPLLLDVVARSPRAAFSPDWREGLLRTLEKGDAATRLQALAIVADRTLTGFEAPIGLLAASVDQPHEVRLAAYTALWPQRDKVTPQEFEYLIGRLDLADQPVQVLSASRTVADAPLDDAQLTQLIPRLPQVGPLGVPVDGSKTDG